MPDQHQGHAGEAMRYLRLAEEAGTSHAMANYYAAMASVHAKLEIGHQLELMRKDSYNQANRVSRIGFAGGPAPRT